MGIHVTALDRGGYSAFGGCWYDPREHKVMLNIFGPTNVIDVAIELTQPPTELNYFERGIASSEPTISGNIISLQFQEMSACGEYDIDIFVDSGACHRLTFRAHDEQPYCCYASTPGDEPSDDEDLDGGLVG